MSSASAFDLVKGFRRTFPAESAATPVSSCFPRAPNASPLKGRAPVEGMKDWLLKIGHHPVDIDNLNVIHVAGTKGKGSTCAYVDSFLREHAKRNGIERKIGLYTSPSLWPQNRIRIDSNPLPENVFARSLNEVIKGLSLDGDKSSGSSSPSPGFLQMMALISFHTFIQEGVDVVICEAHHGGQFDATNFVDRPAITAITKIGMDHVDNLGGSIKNIAWHKSGIFKPGVMALTVSQALEAEQEIRCRAEEKNVPILFIQDVKSALLEFVDSNTFESIPLESRENVALAAQIAHKFLQDKGSSLNELDVKAGVNNCRWPGRFDIVNSKGSTWYLDGAHNETSMEVVARWYKRVTEANSPRILIFAHFSHQRTRDWIKILETLGNSLNWQIQHVIFVQEIEYDTHFSTTKERLDEYAQLWQDNSPSCSIHKTTTVAEGIEKAREFGTQTNILVTGSLYLVEAALKIVSV
ncbi:hypothetical protein N7456_012153 [Penicillium angulare]|uniref:tetrahydrofolate synthase n=1 Tax=Penicillium angulare TaxID=116970 RepID=A0A9W9EV45_9EURO|nr:hypothetical protein N7456_012153 [Penicillium angulare]